jgi:uncharacterized membrane protein
MPTMLSKIVFASLISTATLFGTLAIGSVAQAAPVVNCTIPLGTIDLVNKNYASCPASVTVTWDSAYQSSNQEIAECAGISGGGGGGSGSGRPGKLKG